MKDLGPQDSIAGRTHDREVSVQELVRETGIEMARLRASTEALEQLDRNEWERTQRLAHNIAARAQGLNLAVLASCARELERFAGAIVTGDPKGQAAALQGAAIATEAIDLELRVLAQSEGLPNQGAIV
jgi:hypothetical protein